MAELTIQQVYYRHFLEQKERNQLLEAQLNESEGSTSSNSFSSSIASGWNTFKAVKWHALTVLQVYWMTITVFPPLTVLVVPHYPKRDIWSDKFFIPITNFFMFCVADFVGRFVSKNLKLSVERPKLLFFLSCSRWLLVPLVMMCNAHPRSHLPVWFMNEFMFIFLVTLIGLSNGYLYIVAMINGPEYVSNDLRAKTGFVLVLFLGFGVALGSITSNFILRLL
jgi:equilibrative nucleoside transporter 1/2/3